MHFRFFDFWTAALKTVYMNKWVHCKVAPTHYTYGRIGIGTLQWRGTRSSGYDAASLGTWFPTFRDGLVASPSTVRTPQRQLQGLETSGTKYSQTRHQIPDVLPTHPHCCKNQKTLAMKVITAHLRLLNVLLWKGNYKSHVTLNPDIKLFLSLANHSTSRKTNQMKVAAEGAVTDGMSVPYEWRSQLRNTRRQPTSSLPHVSSVSIPGESVPTSTGYESISNPGPS